MRWDVHEKPRTALGRWIHRRVHRATLLLNGKVLKQCTAFDTRQDWVDVYSASDRGGRPILSADRSHVLKERLYGKVKVVW